MKRDYWKIRDLIIQAGLDEDEHTLMELKIAYPDIFINVMNQAEKELKRRKGKHKKSHVYDPEQ